MTGGEGEGPGRRLDRLRSPEEIEARRKWVQKTLTRFDLLPRRQGTEISQELLRFVAETLEWTQGNAAPLTERLLLNGNRTLDALGVQDLRDDRGDRDPRDDRDDQDDQDEGEEQHADPEPG